MPNDQQAWLLSLPNAKQFSRFKKELIKVGTFTKGAMKFIVTKDLLRHWAKTFKQWTDNGNKVPVPLTHTNEPDKNRGWVTGMEVIGDTLVGTLELSDDELAKTTDVSIYSPPEVVDGNGVVYQRPIIHVALCLDPVVPGLGDFETIAASFQLEGSEMPEDTGGEGGGLAAIAKALGLSADADEAAILAAIEALIAQGVIKKQEAPPEEPSVAASLSAADERLTKVEADLATLAKALAKTGKTGPQVLSLAGGGVASGEDGLARAMTKLRANAGMEG